MNNTNKNILNTDLSGKVAVVTGAGGVLCSNFAKVLARAGAKVALLDLNEAAAKAFADEIGKSWSFVAKIESPTRPFGVSMETMFKIADVLKVPVSKLFED